MRQVLIIIFALSISQIHAQENDLRKKHYNVKKDVAMEGFDPVSYFDGAPKEGESNLKFAYKGVKAAPDKYEPAYGGWCAYAMGESGEKVKIDPETYTILDGKLYLFYNFWGTNTLKDWKKDEKKLKEAGDRNWKKIVP